MLTRDEVTDPLSDLEADRIEEERILSEQRTSRAATFDTRPVRGATTDESSDP